VGEEDRRDRLEEKVGGAHGAIHALSCTAVKPGHKPGSRPGGNATGFMQFTSSALAVVHRELIIALAARPKLPAVSYRRLFVTDGGLICYGPDFVDQFRLAAGYVDRILKGEKPADLPVQAPSKHELVINLARSRPYPEHLSKAVNLFARADRDYNRSGRDATELQDKRLPLDF
jgi:hypothetical protein